MVSSRSERGSARGVGCAFQEEPGAPSDTTGELYAAVTFTVNKWFRGGSGDTVTVNMMAPLAAGEVFSESGPSYGVGTLLLVSGEPRSDQSDLSGALAWGCGYTRYYDQQTADCCREAIAGH